MLVSGLFGAKEFKFNKLIKYNTRSIYVLLLIKIKTVLQVLRIMRHEIIEWLKIEVYAGANTMLDLICGELLFGWN